MIFIRMTLKCLLAFLMVFAGTAHFLNPGFFLKIMPPYLPFHLELIYLSGLFELTCGVCLLIPPLSRTAAWGLIVLLVAVFPANIYLYQHQKIVPASPTIHFVRLLLQAVLIWWAYQYTKRAKQDMN